MQDPFTDNGKNKSFVNVGMKNSYTAENIDESISIYLEDLFGVIDKYFN